MADDQALIELTADIVSAHVSNNTVSLSDVAGLVKGVHSALAQLNAPPVAAEPEAKTPVVTARASVKPDYLICMMCGNRQKTLKRHLMTAHDLTPDQYRAEFGLPRSYPMVSPDYSRQRGDLARSIGLGRKKDPAAPEEAKPAQARRKRQGRPGQAAAKKATPKPAEA